MLGKFFWDYHLALVLLMKQKNKKQNSLTSAYNNCTHSNVIAHDCFMLDRHEQTRETI